MVLVLYALLASWMLVGYKFSFLPLRRCWMDNLAPFPTSS